MPDKPEPGTESEFRNREFRFRFLYKKWDTPERTERPTASDYTQKIVRTELFAGDIVLAECLLYQVQCGFGKNYDFQSGCGMFSQTIVLSNIEIVGWDCRGGECVSFAHARVGKA